MLLLKLQLVYSLYDSFHVYAAPDVLQRYGDHFLTRLKMLYTQAKELSESEVKYAFFRSVSTCSPIFNFPSPTFLIGCLDVTINMI